MVRRLIDDRWIDYCKRYFNGINMREFLEMATVKNLLFSIKF